MGSVVKEKVSGQYGIIRWIGALSGSKDVHAGVEMVRIVYLKLVEMIQVYICTVLYGLN